MVATIDTTTRNTIENDLTKKTKKDKKQIAYTYLAD